MTAHNLTPTQDNFKLMLLNAEAESISSSDFYLWLSETGLPDEVIIRLKNLIDVTEKVANRVISVGKIVLMKVIEFIKAYPNLAVGVALGAAVGALVSTIPFLGVYLAPIVTAISVTIGAIAGHRLDKIEAGKTINADVSLVSIGTDVIEIAKLFFVLLIDIFNAVFDKRILG